MYRDSGNIDLCTADLALCTGTAVILICESGPCAMYRDSGNIDLCTADLMLCTGTAVILICVQRTSCYVQGQR